MESSEKPAQVLVVAHKTAATQPLLDAVRQRAQRGPSEFTLLVPNTAHGLHKVVDPEDQGAGEARTVIDAAVPALSEAAGAPVEAIVGDADPVAAVHDAINLHHFLRRGTNYGPPLPEGVLEDDGEQRGGVFLFVGAHLERQFEFVQSQWVTDGNFISHGTEQDPILGNAEGEGIFTIPKHPLRRRLHGLPQFVAVRGGEYCFMPGLRALKWLASLNDKGGESNGDQ